MPRLPPLRRSPLSYRAPIEAAGGLHMAELPHAGKFILRADADEVVERLRVSLGLGLPFDPLTSSTDGRSAFLWMGPDEWMLVTAPGEEAARSEEVMEGVAGTHHQFVEVTDYYTIIEVAGASARELLMKLTTLDLHPRAFGPGMVSGAIVGRANAMIWLPAYAPNDAPAFQLFIRWSMADYLWCLLADAGREWGLPAQVPVKGETLAIA